MATQRGRHRRPKVNPAKEVVLRKGGRALAVSAIGLGVVTMSTQTAAADEMPAQQPATNQEQPTEFVWSVGDFPQISMGKEEQLSWGDFISGVTVGPEQPDTWDWGAFFSVPEPEPETVNQEQPEQQPTDEQAFGRVVAETAALAALESLTVEKKHVDGGEQWLNDKGEVIAEVSTGG